MTRLAARDVHLTDWRWQLGTLRADFATRSLAQATAFLTDVSPLLDGEATVPVVQVNRDRVLITLKDPSRASPGARPNWPNASASWPHSTV